MISSYLCTAILQQAKDEVEQHLRTAEMLSLKGDTRGQKDQIVNELLKVHDRFQARIAEYQVLLKMTITFFKNLHQVRLVAAVYLISIVEEPLPIFIRSFN